MAWGHSSLLLNNPRLPDLPPVAIEALTSTGAWHLCIPESIRSQLALEAIDWRDVTCTDGRKPSSPTSARLTYGSETAWDAPAPW